MEQRDLLKDQIEQVGKVLSKILSDFLGLKNNVPIATAFEISNEQLKSALDIDINDLIILDKAKLEQYVTDKKLSAEHLETLSNYLEEVGTVNSDENPEMAERYLHTSIALLELADKVSNSVSFERLDRKQRIQEAIDRY